MDKTGKTENIALISLHFAIVKHLQPDLINTFVLSHQLALLVASSEIITGMASRVLPLHSYFWVIDH